MAETHAYGKYVKLMIYFVVIVLINAAGITLFFRADLTENSVYSISDASRRVVATLSEPLTINVFFTRDLPAPYNGTERYLRDLLEEYAISANPYFNYRFYDVNPEEDGIGGKSSENQQLADNYGINPVQIQAIEQDAVKFKRAYMGLVMLHGDQVERIPTITTTEGLEYKITTAMQKLNNKVSALLNLDDKIHVDLYMSATLDQVAQYMGLENLPEFPTALEEIVADLNVKTYDKLAYRHIDPKTQEEQASLVAEYGLVNLKWPAIAEHSVPPGSGVIGLVMRYGEKELTMPLLSVFRLPIIGTQYEMVAIEDMERVITDSIESLVDINETLGYVADFGTPSLFGGRTPQAGAMSAFNTLASQTYSFNQVRLQEETVPESLKTLLIVRPGQTFSDYALYQIDQALMRGTNLALFVDAFKEPVGPGGQPLGPRGGGPQPFDSGLEKLLEHYGVRISKTIVLDENCYKQPIGREFGGGEQPLYFAPIIQNEKINKDVAVMENIKGLIALQISPIEVDEQRIAENGLTARRLFSSSDQSWEMGEPIRLDPMTLVPPPNDADKESLPLAYVIEGEFPSYFAGKPIPEKPRAEADDAPEAEGEAEQTEDAETATQIEGAPITLDKGAPAKILLIASSEMIQDRVLDPEGQSPNAMFVMNMIDYLNDRESIAQMRSKVQRFNPLSPTDAATKTVIKTAGIAGLPVLVVLFGLAVWFRRASRKKAIQEMFQNR